VTRESASLAEALAIILWLTVLANIGVWYALSSLLLESAHRERYGQYQSRWRLMLDVVRHPLSAPGIIGRDWAAKYRAWYNAADNPAVESRRMGTWAIFGAYVVLMLFGLPVSFVVIAVIRTVLPGTLTLWVLVADAILFIAWAHEGARVLSSQPRRPVIIGAVVIGSLTCLLSAAVSLALWRAGGIAL